MRLPECVAPYDVVVLPLFNKEGMPELSSNIFKILCSSNRVVPTIDAFGKSIGKRYARADEIGIPWAITVDHQSVMDNTVTVRRRDDQKQIRMEIDKLINLLCDRTLSNSPLWNS